MEYLPKNSVGGQAVVGVIGPDVVGRLTLPSGTGDLGFNCYGIEMLSNGNAARTHAALTDSSLEAFAYFLGRYPGPITLDSVLRRMTSVGSKRTSG